MYKVIWCLGLAIIISCSSEPEILLDESLLVIPKGFPEPDFPEDNGLTPERWALGKKLFYDPVLSLDSTVSCASCHKHSLSFTDGKAVSEGVAKRLGTRNAPSLANVAYHPYLTREGGVPTLEMQILVPVQEHAEFDFNILLIAERLREDPAYVNASLDAYDRPPDPFVITRAIACFERTILSGNSKYDRYINGEHGIFNQQERNGHALFFSDRLACSQCHGGFNLTNYAFENNGLYENYSDPGRFRLTENESDRALFKVPSLRNVEVTAPYMHDGSMATLEEVIDHYNKGGSGHPNKSKLLKPLQMTASEMNDLKAFLLTLTDNEFISNPLFK